MSCPIHDRCTCYAASLHYSTTSGSSQLVPQANNLFLGYEWAAPLVPNPSAWCPLELIQPPSSHSGGSTHGTMSLHNSYSYHPEPLFYEREQKLAPSREQFAAQHSYSSPYIQGVSRMNIPSNHPELLVQTHRNSTSGYGSYNGLSGTNPDHQLAFDEPPPPYPNNSLPVTDVFSQSALLPTDRHLSVGQVTQSPLTPVPQRHSSLYQVLNLKQEYPASPTLGAVTLQSGVSSIAHALELQEPPARQAPPPCTPVIGNARGYPIGASESVTSASQMPMSSLAVEAAAPCPPLPPAHRPVSSATPPCASVPTQTGSVVTPLQAHTLVPALPEVTHDYDTFPRLRKSSRLIQLQPAPGSAKEVKEEHSTASSPLSPLSSRPSSSMGAPTLSSSLDSNSALESAFSLPLLGRKRPVLRAKLACLFCRRRKIQCRPLPGDQLSNSCQQCAKRCRKCEYPEMTWRGRGKKRSRSDDESDDEEDPPLRMRSRRDT